MNELSRICDGKKFELLASADSSTFVLRSKSDFYIAHLQGSEAAYFHEDYCALQQQFPALDPDEALSLLWDQGGYSWFAAQYGD